MTTTAVRERPILFSGPMVKAIIDGRKTQTRRVIRDAHGAFWDHAAYTPVVEGGRIDRWVAENPTVMVREGAPRPECPYGAPGDRLWVRESWRPYNVVGDMRTRPDKGIIYAADGHRISNPNAGPIWTISGTNKWRPSIHMPRWASRLTLEVVGVRVERLFDISEADAVAEGYAETRTDQPGWDGVRGRVMLTAADNFLAGEWARQQQGNPWVFVIEFRKVEA